MIESYLDEVRGLLNLGATADDDLRKYESSSATARKRHQDAYASDVNRLRAAQRELAELTELARQNKVPLNGSSTAGTADPGSDPLALLEQVNGRLREALEAAVHTQAALAAEQARVRRDREERAERERLRREAEAATLAEARVRDKIVTATLAVATCLAAAIGAAVASVASVLVPAAGLAVGTFVAEQRPSTLLPRLAVAVLRKNAGPSALAVFGLAAAVPIFGLYGCAALAGGDVAGGAIGVAVAVVSASVTAALRARHTK